MCESVEISVVPAAHIRGFSVLLRHRLTIAPQAVEEAQRIKVPAVIDVEVICTDEDGRADFDRLHSRCFEHEAIACAFDLLRLDGDDLRRLPLSARKRSCASCYHALAMAFSTCGTSKPMVKNRSKLRAALD